MRHVLAPAAALSIAACSLTALDGFSGGGEGALDASDDGGPAAADVVVAADAGSEGGDEGGAPFCATRPGAAVCEDWDVGDPLLRWTKEVTGTGGSAEIVDGPVRSAPRALRATVGTSNTSRGSFLRRSLPGSVTHAKVGYSLFVEQRPTSSEIETNIVIFRLPDSSTQEFYLAIDAGGASIVEQRSGPVNDYTALGDAIPTGRWVRVELDISFAGSRTFVLTIDGVERLRRPLVYAGTGGSPVLLAGISYAGPEVDRGSIVLDDYVFEVLPP